MVFWQVDIIGVRVIPTLTLLLWKIALLDQDHRRADARPIIV